MKKLVGYICVHPNHGHGCPCGIKEAELRGFEAAKKKAAEICRHTYTDNLKEVNQKWQVLSLARNIEALTPDEEVKR